MKTAWRPILGLIISVVFLYVAFRGQDFGEIRAALRSVDYWYLIPALGLYFAGVLVRAVRWSILLRPAATITARQVFPIVVIGYTANNVLPLRTGELVRSFVLGQRFGVRKTTALATIAIERLFDGLTMLAFLLLATAFVSFTSELQHVALLAVAVFAVILIGLFVLTLGGSFRDRLLQLVLGPLPTSIADRVERMAESFLSGLGVLRRRRDLALVAATSLLAWTLEAGMYWVIAIGFGGDLRDVMSFAAALMTTGVANLATLIPSSPGYVGPFETATILVVNGALGIPRAIALSYAIVVHAALWAPITILGALIWARMQLSLARVRQDTTSTREDPIDPDSAARPVAD
ncbi:MAG TPA: lysylphosphatidylglycerol synthase transmembrane domain-containing protein [Thermomicrobiales bacterium]|nr:lysylphosphatidylglycerol synthase transmembrane domain-containing protein [Thermomicrobiales bacterium]